MPPQFNSSHQSSEHTTRQSTPPKADERPHTRKTKPDRLPRQGRSHEIRSRDCARSLQICALVPLEPSVGARANTDRTQPLPLRPPNRQISKATADTFPEERRPHIRP